MDAPASAQRVPAGRLLLLPLFHETPECAYSAIAPLFSSPSMTHFSQSVHILSQSIPAAISIDPATVATAIEVSALNDMMIDDPSICTPLLGALSHSWQPEPLSSGHLIEACRSLSQAWVQSPSLFDTAAAILANNASQEQWNCAQRCLSSLKLALACQVVLISDVDFPSGPFRPSSGFNPQPTLTASLVLSPSLSFPPMHYLLSQPFPKISNVVSSSLSNNKYTMTCSSPPSLLPCYVLSRRVIFLSSAVGQVSAVQSGSFSGRAMTVCLSSSVDPSSHPPFSAIARATAGQLFPLALQIETHYQCRCTARSALLPPKLIKQWELPLFGFFTADATGCNPSNHSSGEMPTCSSAHAEFSAAPSTATGNGVGCESSSRDTLNQGAVDNLNQGAVDNLNQGAVGCSGKLLGNKLHLLALRESSSVSDCSLALACSLFQQQQQGPPASCVDPSAIPGHKLPLLSADCILKLCDPSVEADDAFWDKCNDGGTSHPKPLINHVSVGQPAAPPFQLYESKFRFLDLQVPPVLRPVVPCVFAAAVSAASASTSGPQECGASSFVAASSTAVHPLSLSPTRRTQADKHDKRPASASARSLKQASKRPKTSDTAFAGPSSRVPASASSNAMPAPDTVAGDVSAFASVNGASPSLVPPSAVVATNSVVASSSQNLKVDKESPGYELLKSKLWSKLHTKFRRESQPAVDIGLLKIVFNSMLRDWSPIVAKMGSEFSEDRLDLLLHGCEHQASGMLKSDLASLPIRKQKRATS